MNNNKKYIDNNSADGTLILISGNKDKYDIADSSDGGDGD